MSTFTTTLASLALAAASFAVGAAPASAAPLGASVEVRHGDLDLTSPHDVARLHRRIAQAARAVCGSYDPRNFPAAASAKACINETIAAADPKVALAVARAGGAEKLAGKQSVGTIAIR